MLTRMALASGFSATAFFTASTLIPRGIPSRWSHSGFTYTGTAPHSTIAPMTLRWTFLGRMIFSPLFATVSIMLCTADVVPPTMRKAWAAPKAWAASISASRITETGWQRLSRGFMELTSMDTHRSPRSLVSSGLPRPLLCPGTSKGTTLIFPNFSSAS